MKLTTDSIRNSKNHDILTMVTVYDYLFAKLFDGRVDILLVGDSLNMSFNGQPDNLSLTLDELIYHVKAVCRGANQSLIVADMPFGSSHTPELALENCTRIYKETHAKAVKFEGGIEVANTVAYLVERGIAVMGHIGLKPQLVRQEGGYKVKGKKEEERDHLIQDAQALEQAGVFCMVLEGVKREVAKEVSAHTSVPVIGIGAGPDVDGQVLVWSDMLGFFEDFQPKFVRRYLEGGNLVREALDQYCDDVKNRRFPSQDESY